MQLTKFRLKIVVNFTKTSQQNKELMRYYIYNRDISVFNLKGTFQ